MAKNVRDDGEVAGRAWRRATRGSVRGPGWAVPRCCLLPLLLVASASKQHVPSSVLPLTQPDSYGYSRAARKLRDSA